MMDAIRETFAPAAKSAMETEEAKEPSPLTLLLQTLRQQLPGDPALTVALLKQVATPGRREA